ncbi:unnamed protein product, partial [Effrenium voratum]
SAKKYEKKDGKEKVLGQLFEPSPKTLVREGIYMCYFVYRPQPAARLYGQLAELSLTLALRPRLDLVDLAG